MRTAWILTLLLILSMTAPVLAAPAPAPAHIPARSAAEINAHNLRPAVSQAELMAGFEQTAAFLDGYAASVPNRPDPAKQAQTTAQWTVLIHVAGDNNLEIAALGDINEMEAVGSSEEVNIVVQIDRSADYVDLDGDWTEGRRYYIQQDDDPRAITSPVIENLGEINSGDPDVLADFMIWGITTYPAEKYMLVMWDHGGAWISHSSDEDTGDDMDLLEFKGALDRVKAETGIDKFEVIGFDMCLMAQIEVFQAIEPYAHYGIGSEENEPGAGWFYVYLAELVKNPAMDGGALGKHVVDYFMYFLSEVIGDKDVYGLSVVDLSESSQMMAALDAFTALANASPQAELSNIADARNNTISYGGFNDPQIQDVWSSIDLYQFADLLTQLTRNPDLQDAAEAVTSAIDSFVIYEQHVDALAGSHGVSIYFPRTFKAYKIGAFNERYPAEAPASMASWIQFLNIFHGTATATVTEAPGVSIIQTYPDVASIYNPAIVSLEVSGRDILRVNYVVSQIISQNERVALDYDYLVSRTTTGSGVQIVDWSDGVTQRTFAWEAEVPMLTDGAVSTFALIIPNQDNPNVGLVNGQYMAAAGGKPIEAQLLFDLTTRRSTAVWGLNQTASGNLQPFEVQVGPGDTFQPLWLTLDANNELAGSSLGETLTLQGAGSITFEKVPAPTGNYSISFVAENVSGINNLSEAIIRVNNDGLDPAYRGYTDLVYGVNFNYPGHWIRPRFLQDGKRLFTADLVTETVMSLYPYTGVRSAAETDAAIRASWSDLPELQITQEREVTINGLPAFVTDYTYTYKTDAGDQPRLGAVVAIYVPSQGVGYGFDLDAPADQTGPAEQALQALVNSINFFDTGDVVGESAWREVTAAGGQITFPIPATWTEDISGGWTLYGPVDNNAVFVGIASGTTAGSSNADLAQRWIDQLETGVSNLDIAASEPFFIGNREWHVVVFTFDGDVKTAGAFFAITAVGGQDVVFWIQAPDTYFDQLYAEVFSIIIGGFAVGE